MSDVLKSRLRSETETSSRSHHTARNHLQASVLVELLEERKSSKNRQELVRLAEMYGVDLAKLESVARHVNTPSIDEDSITKRIGENGEETVTMRVGVVRSSRDRSRTRLTGSLTIIGCMGRSQSIPETSAGDMRLIHTEMFRAGDRESRGRGSGSSPLHGGYRTWRFRCSQTLNLRYTFSTKSSRDQHPLIFQMLWKQNIRGLGQQWSRKFLHQCHRGTTSKIRQLPAGLFPSSVLILGSILYYSHNRIVYGDGALSVPRAEPSAPLPQASHTCREDEELYVIGWGSNKYVVNTHSPRTELILYEEDVCYRQTRRTLKASRHPLSFPGSGMRYSETWLYIKGMPRALTHAVTSTNGGMGSTERAPSSAQH